MRPIRARGEEYSPGHRPPPSHHPPAQHRPGQAPVLVLSHASWTAGAGQRAPTFSPFLPFCNHTHLPSTHFETLPGPRCRVCQRGPGLERLRSRGSVHLHPHGLPRSGRPFQASARPPTLAGPARPPDEGAPPPFPGKFANTAVPEPGNRWKLRPQGLRRAGARAGRGRQGADGSRAHSSGESPAAPRRRPPPGLTLSPERAPARTEISRGAAGSGLPTPSRKDTPALPAAHGKREGANLDGVRRPELCRAAFPGASGLIG